MERKLGYAILAAVVTFAILQPTIGTASFKPSSTLVSSQSSDAPTLRQNASLYAAEAAVFVAGIVLVFSYVFTPGEQESSAAGSPAGAMQVLANLKQKGLVTDEEYKSKRAEILKRL